MPEIWWRIYETRHPAEADIDAWFATEPEHRDRGRLVVMDPDVRARSFTTDGLPYSGRLPNTSPLGQRAGPRRPPTLVLSGILLIVSVFRNLPTESYQATDTRVAKKGRQTHSPRPRHAVVPVRLRSSWLAVRK
jgi:hypothetical protein